ncbi:hypothetical protein [Cerasicoccus fimbriatus]|uniref:hypothetical protein n=1 Tax=Cerasicoccus fimbriatus TaxID=3014554 RepID=UPI0022B46D49|nr:hypothetical protein [Cerasicoccus sp. TK19100]
MKKSHKRLIALVGLWCLGATAAHAEAVDMTSVTTEFVTNAAIILASLLACAIAGLPVFFAIRAIYASKMGLKAATSR